MSKHPIGATWKCHDKESGKIGRIWLESRDNGYEVWKWSWCFADGSHPWYHADWNTSYRACKDEIPIDARFKRIK